MSRSNVRTLSESRTLRKGRKNGEACVKVVIQQNNNLWLILINMQKNLVKLYSKMLLITFILVQVVVLIFIFVKHV